MKQLALKPAVDSVHYVHVSKSAVPAFVHNLAAKSSKFIPDAKPNTIRQVMASFDSFMRSMILAHFFSGKRESDDNKTRKTSRGNKSWLPKLDDDMTSRFDIYRRLTKAEILDSWPSCRSIVKNFTRLDIKAVRWLEAHASATKIVDTDKNLGNAIVSAPWIDAQCRKWLAKSMKPIAMGDMGTRMALMKSRLQRMVDKASSACSITKQQAQFLLAQLQSDAVPAVRINVKIHKTPVDSRPICNNSRFCLCNAGIFLSAYLRDLVVRCPNVITSHLAVINWAESYKPGPNDRLVVFDIVALYPNLPVWADGSGHSLYEIVSGRIWQFYGIADPNLALLLDSILHVILSNQFVQYDGIQYEAWQGLNTGLHAASELANVFLSVFDLHVVSMLDKVCKFYARFIDDGLLCIDMSTTDDTSIFSILNGWNRHIQTDPVTSSCTQHFLDVQLTLRLQDGDVPAEVDYQLYRKPLNIYNYIPANSDHPISVCRSIVHTEAVRLLRTNKRHETFDIQRSLFARLLGRRGHSQSTIWSILHRYPFVDKENILSRLQRKKSGQVRKCVLKIRHAKCQRIPLMPALKKHLHLISRGSFNVQPVIAKSNGPNLFRQLYRYTWRHTG